MRWRRGGCCWKSSRKGEVERRRVVLERQGYWVRGRSASGKNRGEAGTVRRWRRRGALLMEGR